MNEGKAVIIGASGMIGNYLLHEILEDDHFTMVRILVRRKISIQHKKLQQEIIDFNDLKDFETKFGTGDVIFSCIGTTQKNVKGNNELYKKIDYEIPLNAARIGQSKGFTKFLMVSSVGANGLSSNFYLRLKGELENEVEKTPFKTISFFRPSMLLGARNESRPFETILQGGIKFISFFLVGKLQRFHSIDGKVVAKAMIAQCKKNNSGVHVLEYSEMIKLVK